MNFNISKYTPTKIMNTMNDWLGLTDTKAPQRGLEALDAASGQAGRQLDTAMLPVFNMYGNAMEGRDMDSILDTYQQQMMGTENAASADNVQNFMNPMYSRALSNATNQALAGAGSSLQSSAANAAVGTAVGNEVQNMWQQAFNNAMADANNKQGVYTNTMQTNLMPALNWAQLTSDIAGTKYTKDMDLAQARGQVAGQDTSWFGNLF